MFCPTCGQKVQPENKVCSNCGTALPQPPADPVAAAPSSTAGAGLPLIVASSTAEMHRPLVGGTLHAANSVASNPAVPDSHTVEPPREDSATPVVQLKQCPQCGKLHSSDNTLCDACGTALHAPAGPPAKPRGFIPTAYDFVPSPPQAREVRPRKSRLPVLEILIAVLLLVGAAFSVWMLRSSLPGKSLVPASNVEVTISPASAKVVAGNAFDFAATVNGTDDAEVTWTVQEGDAGGRVVPRGAKAGSGAVSLLAVYIAPASPGTYHLLATSKADPRKSATAEITVTKR
jgi:ribosomal protein L32